MPPKKGKKGGKGKKGKSASKSTFGQDPLKVMKSLKEALNKNFQAAGIGMEPGIVQKFESAIVEGSGKLVLSGDRPGLQGSKAILQSLVEVPAASIRIMCCWRTMLGDEGMRPMVLLSIHLFSFH